ncbi:MAG TPA: 2-amino-4-hydroxy-6-hydroxymethyldihydropteridine diphosphokinase [Polyangiaceae bacterium]|nr:2-amino-4-hydroxy-6-hydroxymethyldihydropteridine diphosphokinase [Polyangiaceae bacterium]
MRPPSSNPAPRGVLDVVIGLGANLGDRQATLEWAVSAVGTLGRVAGVSQLYTSPPVGPPQPDYLNAAVRLLTELELAALLEALLGFERQAGRQRRERWGPRTLDLDILWAAGVVSDSVALRVPHPELRVRPFALLPLLDVAPAARDPGDDMPYAVLLRELDGASVRRIGWSLATENCGAAVDTAAS